MSPPVDKPDGELKAGLSHLLPDLIEHDYVWLWKPGSGVIRETEWMHICYLARVKHSLAIGVAWNEPWQEQARRLLSAAEVFEKAVSNHTGKELREIMEKAGISEPKA